MTILDADTKADLTWLDISKAGQSGETIDFDAWQARRRQNGELAEELVVKAEQERLRRVNRSDLAAKVLRVSSDHTVGFDIQSWNEDGSPRQIEVKSVRDEDDAFSFYLTENEWQKSRALPGYHFYFVFGVRTEKPLIRFVPAFAMRQEFLRPVVHTVTLNF